MITVVCSIANREIYDKCLGKSLKQQNIPFKFIEAPVSLPIVPSYNSVKDKIKTKYVVFIHQDIVMLETTWLQRCEQFCDNIPDLGVAGVAGKSWGGKCTGYIIHMGHPKFNTTYYGKKYRASGFGHPIIKPELTQTIDTVVIVIPTEIFKKIQFDENLNQEFSVDYCLAVKWYLKKNTYALPLKTWHSPFTTVSGVKLTSKSYEKKQQFHTKAGLIKAQEYIKKKWKDKFNLIFGTCDIDVCPRCKTNPCICRNPLSMRESINWGK